MYARANESKTNKAHPQNEASRSFSRPSLPTHPLTPPLLELQRIIGNQATERAANARLEGEPSVPPVFQPVPPSHGQPLDAAARSYMERRFGHDFSRISIWPAQHNQGNARLKVAESGREDLDAPLPDDVFRRLADDVFRRAQAPLPAPAPAPPAPPAPAAPSLSASLAIAPPLSASLAITGDAYTDTVHESRKKVKFNVTWNGGVKEDYIIVNWVKGYMKNPAGKPYKSMLYGTLADFDYSSWQVDSLDADPAYWSEGGTRWRYNVDGPNKFSAKDSPGPMFTEDGKGAKARLDFLTAVYKSSDVLPTAASKKGTIDATPLTSYHPWQYHVEVLGGGKFNHKL